MKLDIIEEVTTLDDGSYTAIVNCITQYNDDKVLMKLNLEDGQTLVKFYDIKDLCSYPWGSVFKAVGGDTDNLIGKKISFNIENAVSKKTGYVFSNLKSIKILD